METEKELNSKILRINMAIQEKYPGLTNYLGRSLIQFTMKKNADGTLKSLKEYYDSLDSLLKKYIAGHTHHCKVKNIITKKIIIRQPPKIDSSNT